jgi:hypothetical protein
MSRIFAVAEIVIVPDLSATGIHDKNSSVRPTSRRDDAAEKNWSAGEIAFSVSPALTPRRAQCDFRAYACHRFLNPAFVIRKFCR